MTKQIIKNLIYPLATLTAILIVWWVAAKIYNIPLILPTPNETWRRLCLTLTDGQFYRAYMSTLQRAAIGCLISFAITFLLVLMSLAMPRIRKICETLTTVIRSVPTMAVILMIIIWTDPYVTPLIVALLITLPSTYAAMLGGAHVDRDLREIALVYGASPLDLVRDVYLPSMKQAVVEGFAGGFSLTLKLTVSAEVLAQTAQSIGNIMQQSRINLETDLLIAVTLVVVATCLVLENVIRYGLRALLTRRRKFKGNVIAIDENNEQERLHNQ